MPPQWAPPQPQWGPPQPQWGPPQPQWGPPQPQWTPAPASPLPTTPTAYHHFYRAPGIAPWRPIVALVAGAALFLVVTTVVPMLGLLVDVQVGGGSLGGYLDDIVDGVLPRWMTAFAFVSIALMLPLCAVLARIVGQPFGYLSSVTGRFRWGFFWRMMAVAVVAFGILTAVNLAISPQPPLEVLSDSWPMLVVLLVAIPFQAAAEEYMLRGLVFRAVGSWLPDPRAGLAVGALVSSLLFAVLHGASDPWLNAFYFGMALLCCYATWRTGGLEVAVAVHVVNNLIAASFLPFMPTPDVFDREAGVGDPTVLLQLLAVGAVVAAGSLWAARGRVAALGPTATRAAVQP